VETRIITCPGWTGRLPLEAGFSGDNDPGDEIGDESGPSHESEYYPGDPDDRRIDIEVFTDPPADPADHPVGIREIELLLYGHPTGKQSDRNIQ